MKCTAGFFFVLLSSLLVGLPQPITAGEGRQVVEKIPHEEMIAYKDKIACVQTEEREVEIEINTDNEQISTVAVPQIIYYDIPLEYNLQQFIIQSCLEKQLDPELVFAVIEKESTYNPDLIGDNGNSFGLMQIQYRWHTDRMKALDCTDLLNPYENVYVGIDILAELFDKYPNDINYVLMCYNGGEMFAQKQVAKGIYTTEYTRAVREIQIAIHGKQQHND